MPLLTELVPDRTARAINMALLAELAGALPSSVVYPAVLTVNEATRAPDRLPTKKPLTLNYPASVLFC